MAEIIVYTKSHCPQCDATKRRLDRLSIPYRTVNLDTDPNMVAELTAKGFKQTPIVEAGSESWSGYRPDLIDKLKA